MFYLYIYIQLQDTIDHSKLSISTMMDDGLIGYSFSYILF